MHRYIWYNILHIIPHLRHEEIPPSPPRNLKFWGPGTIQPGILTSSGSFCVSISHLKLSERKKNQQKHLRKTQCWSESTQKKHHEAAKSHDSSPPRTSPTPGGHLIWHQAHLQLHGFQLLGRLWEALRNLRRRHCIACSVFLNGKTIGKPSENGGWMGFNGVWPSGKRLHNYRKSPVSMAESTINGHVQQLCQFTRG